MVFEKTGSMYKLREEFHVPSPSESTSGPGGQKHYVDWDRGPLSGYLCGQMVEGQRGLTPEFKGTLRAPQGDRKL